MTIRKCVDADFDAIHSIVNEAAEKYRGAIPADCWRQPYMSRESLRGEIEAGVDFLGMEDDGVLVGVMGLQKVKDVTLVRHAYVRSAMQGKGVGGALIETLAAYATGRFLVGTWAAAAWAIGFYQRHGFRLASPTEKDALLDTYWSISERQRDVSVVLERIGI